MIQRNTHQRDSIRDFIQAADRPLSPSEILGGAQRKVPRLGMATVYRTVKELVDSHWLRPVELPGEPARYELADKDHHHYFHCRHCNRVYNVPGCPGDLRPMVPTGFELQDHEVVFYGKCERCLLAPLKKHRKRDSIAGHVHGADSDHTTTHSAPAHAHAHAPTQVAETPVAPGADGHGRAKGFGREMTEVHEESMLVTSKSA